jgi:hypothetical protein
MVVEFTSIHAGLSREISTGPDEAASLAVPCRVFGKRVLFWTRCFVYFNDRWFKVTVAGYEGTGREPLAWYTAWNKGVENPDPPPIRVELRRLPAAGEG